MQNTIQLSGKETDLCSVKEDVLSNFEQHIVSIKKTASELTETDKRESVYQCPICKSSTDKSECKLSIYGFDYHQCEHCTHVFVINRPTQKTLQEYYSKSNNYAETYTNQKLLKTRLEQIYIPKAKWVLEQFQLTYGRRPNLILDVGAGGGHFVQACHELGVKSKGIEWSKYGRDFAKNNFDIELHSVDFSKGEIPQSCEETDMVTCWGLIEHFSEPLDLTSAAYNLLKDKEGLVVAEVPRWNALGSTVQKVFPDTINRHLIPFTHIHCFTDSSLCETFDRCGLSPVSAWYFGMDMYELVTQLAYQHKDSTLIESYGRLLMSNQLSLDQACFSDSLVLAGKPT